MKRFRKGDRVIITFGENGEDEHFGHSATVEQCAYLSWAVIYQVRFKDGKVATYGPSWLKPDKAGVIKDFYEQILLLQRGEGQ